jgi:hypothetical protein
MQGVGTRVVVERVVPKKNDTLKIYIDFRKLNATTKKDPYPLPFINEVMNIVVRYEAY